jgi:beta-1,4-mannooligosaccharide/beta-1,4-mannosyl-N-acetylglucosamine phosphorylase
VLTSCYGFVYSIGAALLDLDQPWRVRARSAEYLLSPQAPYERVGDVPNVVFPCAALVDADADRLTVYYGAADTVVCLAHGHLSEVLAFVRGRAPRAYLSATGRGRTPMARARRRATLSVHRRRRFP